MNNFASSPTLLPWGSFAQGQADDLTVRHPDNEGTFADQWNSPVCLPEPWRGSFGDVEYAA